MHATDRNRYARPLALGLLLLGIGHALAQPPAPASGKTLVSDVIVQGSRHVAAEHVVNQMATKVGKEYVPEMLQDDVRALVATRQWANVWADRKDDGPGRVKVFVYLKDLPSVVQRVEYVGNAKLSRDDLDALTGVRKGMPCNPTANKVACSRIVSRYHEEGRLWASCRLRKGGELGDTEVVFDIVEGGIARIASIDFTGNTFVSSAVLRQRINSGAMFLRLPLGGVYNPALLEHDTNVLLRYFREFGYLDAKVSREVRPNPESQTVAVVFHLREGTRYRVAERPKVHGARSVPVESLEVLTKQKAGDFYDQHKIDGDTARINDAIGYRGRQSKTFADPVLIPDRPGFVRVNYQVEEQGPARVGRIIIIGNERTDQRVILRQLPLYPGQTLSFPELRQAERNLARLNIFEASPDGAVRPTVTVQNDPLNPDSPWKNIIVNVNETSTGSLMFGLGVNSDAGFTGSIVLNERNFDLFRPPTSFEDLISGNAFRGAGQEFRLEAVPGTQVQRYMATFREPFLLDTPISLTVSGYYFQRYFNEYAEDRIGARVTLGTKLDDYWSASATVRAEQVGVRDVPAFAPSDYLDVRGSTYQTGVRAGLTHDTRDSVLRPTEGHLFDVGYEQVFGRRNFGLANLEFSQFWTVAQRADGSGRHVVAFHNSTGYATENTPVYERFFGGGFRSIRGFQFRGVGPDIGGFKVGGNFMFTNSLEYQLPVQAGDKVFLVGFVDSGTVSSRIDKWDTYRVSAGFGLRISVPMLGPAPLALDFGFPIVRGRGDREQIFNFFMGFTR
ncbi:MAG: BamA/TamA family outer membrane protein [Gemmataceae bacterium]|nr:BamA/TamA family outer membrane protein [Gemmataceae bacterium]